MPLDMHSLPHRRAYYVEIGALGHELHVERFFGETRDGSGDGVLAVGLGRPYDGNHLGQIKDAVVDELDDGCDHGEAARDGARLVEHDRLHFVRVLQRFGTL